MTPRTRIVLVVAAVAVLGIAFVVASGSGGEDNASSTPSTQAATTPAATPAETNAAETTPAATTTTPAAPAVPVVTVVNGQPKGGVERLQFAKGDTVRFKVRSDVADEIHVHGYDLAKEVAAGGSVAFAFPAKIDGRFEVELEHRGVQIAELEVTP